MDPVDRPAKKPRLSAPPTPIDSADKSVAKVTPAADEATPVADSRSQAQRQQANASARGRVEYQLAQLSDDNLAAIAKKLETSGLYTWGSSLKAFGATSKRHQKIALKAGLGSQQYAHVNTLCEAASDFVVGLIMAKLPIHPNALITMGDVLAPVARVVLFNRMASNIFKPGVMGRANWNALHEGERTSLIIRTCFSIGNRPIGDAGAEVEAQYQTLNMMVNFGVRDSSLDHERLDLVLRFTADKSVRNVDQRNLLKLGIAVCKFSQDFKTKAISRDEEKKKAEDRQKTEAEITQRIETVMAMEFPQKTHGLLLLFSVMPRLSQPVRTRLIDEFIRCAHIDEIDAGMGFSKKEICAAYGGVLMRYASTHQRLQLLGLFADDQVDREGVEMLFGLAQGLADCSVTECTGFVDVVLCIKNLDHKTKAIGHVAGLFKRANPQFDRLVEATMHHPNPIGVALASAEILGGPAAALLSATQRAALAASLVDAITLMPKPINSFSIMKEITPQILDGLSNTQREQLAVLVESASLPVASVAAVCNWAPVFSRSYADRLPEVIKSICSLVHPIHRQVVISKISQHGLPDLTLELQTMVLDAAIEADAKVLAQMNRSNHAHANCEGRAVRGLATGAAHLKGDLFPRLMAQITKITNHALRIEMLSAAAKSFEHAIRTQSQSPRCPALPAPIGSPEKEAVQAASAASAQTPAPVADSPAQPKPTQARTRGQVPFRWDQLSDNNLVAIARGLGSSGPYAWGKALQALGQTSSRNRHIATKFAGLGSERYAHVNSLCKAASELVGGLDLANLPIKKSAFSLMGILAPAQRECLVDRLKNQIFEDVILEPEFWASLYPAERSKMVADVCGDLIRRGPIKDGIEETAELNNMLRFNLENPSLGADDFALLSLAAEHLDHASDQALIKLGIAICKFSQTPPTPEACKRHEEEITGYIDAVIDSDVRCIPDGLRWLLSQMPHLSPPVRSRLIDEFIRMPLHDEPGDEVEDERTPKGELCLDMGKLLMRYASADQRSQLLGFIADGHDERFQSCIPRGLSRGLPYCSDQECEVFVDAVLDMESTVDQSFAIADAAVEFDRPHPQLDRLVEEAVAITEPRDRAYASAMILGNSVAALLTATQRATLAASLVDVIMQIPDSTGEADAMEHLTPQVWDALSQAQRDRLITMLATTVSAVCFSIDNLAPVFSRFDADALAKIISSISIIGDPHFKQTVVSKIGRDGISALPLALQTFVFNEGIQVDAALFAEAPAYHVPYADHSIKGKAIRGLAHGAAHLKGNLFPRLLDEINQLTDPVLRIDALSAAAQSFEQAINNFNSSTSFH
jgi:hypothetical protein